MKDSDGQAKEIWGSHGALRQRLLQEIDLCGRISCRLTPSGGEGVLRISGDGDDQRIFFGFEIFYSGIFLG